MSNTQMNANKKTNQRESAILYPEISYVIQGCIYMRRTLLTLIIVGLIYLFLPRTAWAANLYWVGNDAAATNVATNWKTTDPATCGSGDASAAPTTTDVAIFDADCDNGAAVTGTFSVGGVNMNSGYTGTVTQNAITITIGSSGWTQAGGTFTGNSDGSTANITLGSGGDMNLTGGTFTSTNDTLTVNDDFTVNGGTFTANSGTAYFQASADNAQTITGSFTASALTFYENGCASYTVTIASGTTITATGTTTINGSSCGWSSLNGPGGISAQGDVTTIYDGWKGSTVITVNGTGNQILTGVSNFPTTIGLVPSLTINKSSGNITITNTLAVSDDFTNTSGTALGGTGTLAIWPTTDEATTITGSFTTPGLYFYYSGGGAGIVTIASGTTITVTGTTTFNDVGCCANRQVNGPGGISAQGNITVSGGGMKGSAVITVNGTGDQTLTGVSNFPTAYAMVPPMTINKSSGTITLTNTIAVTDDFTNTSGTAFGGTGTLAFWPKNDNAITITGSFTVPGLYFYDDGCSLFTVTVASGTTITATGTTTFNGNSCNWSSLNGPGGISAQGDITTSTDGWQGNIALTLSGSGNQTITQGSGDSVPTGTVTFNKSGGTITLASAWSINSSGQDLLVAGGSTQTLTGAYTLTVNDSTTISGSLTQGTTTISSSSFTVSQGGTWTNSSTGDITVGSGGVTNNGTMNFGVLSSCGGSDSISITSSSGGTARTWTGSGVFNFYDVTVSDQNETPKRGRVVAWSSTNSSNSNWTFNSNCPAGATAYWKFDDSTGTTAQDSSSNNLDGTLNNTPTWNTEDKCVSGKCLYFDGTNNENVSKSDDSKLDFSDTASFTAQAWVRRNGASSAINYIITKHDVTDDTEDGGYKLYMDDSGDFCFGIDDDITWDPDVSACTSGVDFDDDKWHLATGVRSVTDDKIYLYVDGNQRTSTTDSTTATLANSNIFYIGVDRDGTSNEWLGFIDDAKIYSYARTASQIKEDFLAGAKNASTSQGASEAFGVRTEDYLSTNLKGYWKMDESSGNASDSSGNGITLTNNGTTTFASGKFGNSSYPNTNTKFFSTSTAITQVQTVSFWIKPNATTSSPVDLNGTQTITVTSGTISANNFTSPVIYVNGAVSSTMASGSWQHIVVTTATAFDSGSMTIGKVGSNSLNGYIDEVRIYNKLFSPKEVRDLYSFAPGPVAYWRMDDKVSGDSKTLIDVSGNGSTTTTVDGANNTGMDCSKSGKYGGGCQLDGTDDYIEAIDSDPLSITGDITIEAWVKISDFTNWNGIAGKTSGNQPAPYDFYLIQTTGVPRLFRGNGTVSANADGTSAPALNKWQHLAVTMSGTSVSHYLNGLLNGTGTISTTISDANGTLRIGSRADAVTLMKGLVDEVKIYNYARTQKQINEDMLGSPKPVSGGGGNASSSVGYWKFDEGYSTTANNSGNASGLNGTLTNTPTWSQSGKFGKALQFAGGTASTGQHVSVSNTSAIDITGAFTLSSWIYPTAYASGCGDYPRGGIIAKGGWDTAVGYELLWNGAAGDNYPLEFTIDQATLSLANPFSLNTWYHVTAVNEGANGKTYIYINGIKKASGTGASPTSSSSYALNIGRRDPTNNYACSFTGTIDEPKIYKYALTSDEVKTEYNRGSSLILGSLSDNSSYQKQAANQEYCVPGDSTSCAAPVGEWKFEEGRGTSANDTSGNGNTGTLGGDGSGTDLPVWGNGKYGKGLSFDGSDDFVTAGDIDQSSDFTIETWVNFSNLTNNSWLIEKGTNYWLWLSRNNDWSLGSNNLVFGFYNGSSSQQINPSFSPTANRWYHIVGVRNANNLTLYIDGQLLSSSSTTGSPETNNTSLFFGERSSGAPPSGYRFLSGKLDEVKVYNYARSGAQIAWDYNRGKPIGWWKLDECQGSGANSAKDSSGNSYHGNITIGASGDNSAAGTCTSSGAWYNGVSGKRNYSLDLGGTDDYITVTDTANLRFDANTSDFSLFAWVKRTTTGTEYIISKEDADNDGYRMLFTSSNTVQCSEDATDVTSTSTIADTNWHLIGCTIDRDGNGQVYIDGRLDGSAAAMGTDAMATTSNITLGTRSYTSTSYFNGQIDDVRIYNYSLTGAQVKGIYNEGAVRFGPLTGSP